MNNHKKPLFWNWNFIISFIIAGITKDVVEGLIGFKRIPFINGFNGLNFAEDTLIFMICGMIANSLLVTIKNRCKNK